MTIALEDLRVVTLLILCLVGGLLPGAAQETVSAAKDSKSGQALTQLKSIVLKDQFESVCTYRFPLDRPMVLLAADKKGYEALEPWIQGARDRAGRIALIVGIADVRGVPGFLRAKVRRRFQSGQEHSILLDWDGQVLDLLDPEKGVPNAYLITSGGKVVLHLAGKATLGKLESLQKQLEVISQPTSVPKGSS